MAVYGILFLIKKKKHIYIFSKKKMVHISLCKHERHVGFQKGFVNPSCCRHTMEDFHYKPLFN